MSHVPCTACKSSDAGWRFDDGGVYCYKCGAYDGSGKPGGSGMMLEAAQVQNTVKGPVEFVQVDVRAVPARGLSEDACRKWRYGYGEYRGRKAQVAQYFDATGKLVGQKLRFADKSFMVLGDLKPAGLFGQHLWRDAGRMVVVTEGEIDAISVSQVQALKWPVVSLPNGASAARRAIERSSGWLDGFDRVVLMFDNDDAGRAGALEAAEAITPGKAYIASLPLKDANDVLLAKRGPEIVDACWGAKLYRPDGLVSGEDVWTHVARESTSRSVALPHSGLQAKLHGIRMGEVTTLVAGTGAGKSTVCREWARAFMAAGEKVGYVALEEDVRRSALGLLAIDVGRPLHLLPHEEAMKPDVRAAFDAVKDRVVFYDHFGSLDSDNLMSRIKYIIKGEGASVVFLDHLSIVVSGMDVKDDERRTIDRVMTSMASLAQETGAAIVLVSHLSRREGKPHEEGRPVSLSDLRGSHSIAQLSHNVVSVERDQQDEETKDIATVRVLKCRHTGNCGVAGHLRYDQETGRLQEYAADFESVQEEEL